VKKVQNRPYEVCRGVLGARYFKKKSAASGAESYFELFLG